MEAPGQDYGSGAAVGLGDAPLALGLRELLVGRRECKLSIKKTLGMWASFIWFSMWAFLMNTLLPVVMDNSAKKMLLK